MIANVDEMNSSVKSLDTGFDGVVHLSRLATTRQHHLCWAVFGVSLCSFHVSIAVLSSEESVCCIILTSS